MELGSLFLTIGLLILVGLFISRPFFERKSRALTQEEHEVSSLLAEKDRHLNALHELDFDYALGKVPEEDYAAQRAILVESGVQVMRQLDEHLEQATPELAQDSLEAVIAARSLRQPAPSLAAAGSQPGNGIVDDEIEAMIANRRRNRGEKAVGFCPKCGGPLHKSDRFCPKCGNAQI
jgi:rubrerythrin